MGMQPERNLSISNSNSKVQYKTAAKATAKIAVFLVLVIAVVMLLEALLQNNGSVVARKRLLAHREANSVDVLFIGNSHVYCSYDPAVIEPIVNKRVFNAGLPDQKIDMTYYTLLEQLEKQNPEIIILEAFAFGRTHSGYKGYVANVDAMDLGINKVKACLEIFPDKAEAFRMLFQLFRSHNNWKKPDIVKSNLKAMFGINIDSDEKSTGFYPLTSKMTEDTIKKYQESETSEFTAMIDDYSIEYFHRIVKLCEEKGIRLIITMAPFNSVYLKKINYPKIYDKMQGICDAAGVEYIDFNMLYDKIGLGFDDFEDAFHNAQHTNRWGAEKISKYMADYLIK